MLVDIVHPNVCLSEAQWNDVENLECLLSLPFYQKTANCSFDARNILRGMEKMLFKFAQIGGVVADAMINL